MSEVFAQQHQRPTQTPNPETIQKVCYFIECYFNKVIFMSKLRYWMRIRN